MGPAANVGVASIAMLVGFSSVVTAQDWGRILEEKAKQRVNRHAEETIDKGLEW
jgi:hypothetical protein